MPRVTITVPDSKSQPYRFALDRKTVTLGRGGENDIVIDSTSVSVRHAIMERILGGYELRDLGSTNGTKLDGEARDLIPLEIGMNIRLGEVDFDFSLGVEELELLGLERTGVVSATMREAIEEPVPAPSRPAGVPHRRPQPVLASAKQPGPAASFFTALMFLVFAVAAFFAGMSVKYSQDHKGGSLIKAMREGVDPAPTSAAELPDPSPAEETTGE